MTDPTAAEVLGNEILASIASGEPVELDVVRAELLARAIERVFPGERSAEIQALYDACVMGAA